MTRSMCIVASVVVAIVCSAVIAIGNSAQMSAQMEVVSAVDQPTLAEFVYFYNGFLIDWWKGGGREIVRQGRWKIEITNNALGVGNIAISFDGRKVAVSPPLVVTPTNLDSLTFDAARWSIGVLIKHSRKEK